MSESTKNRRQFLGIAGATLAGVAIAYTSLKLPVAAAEAATRSPTVPQGDSLEAWLLSTGQDEIDPQLLMSVQQQIS